MGLGWGERAGHVKMRFRIVSDVPLTRFRTMEARREEKTLETLTDGAVTRDAVETEMRILLYKVILNGVDF